MNKLSNMMEIKS